VTTTLGKYTLLRKLATGGMAEVFLAQADGPMGFRKKCVVKRILPHFNDDARFIEMFLGEARLAAQLNHPNLVQIFDFGEAGGQYYLAMEYIDGPNLRVLNQAARRQEGPIGFALAARIIALAAEGLHFAHDLRGENGEFLNLVHRDISPDNILVSRSGAVKVVDFGIAKATSQPHLTRSGMIKGKMAYMPPEQLAREPLDRRSDLFALGIVLYELVTGGMPFDATSEVSIIQAIMSQAPLERPSLRRPDCPPALEAIITRCLEKDREARYPSAAALQTDLERFIQSTGQLVGTRDVASLVEFLFEGDSANTNPARSNGDDGLGLDATTPSGKSHERPSGGPYPAAKPKPTAAAVAAPTGEGATGLSNTALRQIDVAKRPTAGIAIGVGVGVLGLAAAAYMALVSRPPPPGPTPTTPVAVLVPPQPTVVADAGATVERADAGTDATPDAGSGADAGAETPTVVTPVVDPSRPVAARPAKLELRIRPYATVYLDEKLLGDTPLPPVTSTAGKHKLRLVNAKLGKNVTLDLVLKPGENVVKHNLKE
jgi:serine/threonine-protein kinase